MSWKVRRASAKCLDAIIGTRHEMLPDFYSTVSPALIARFKGKSSLSHEILPAFYSIDHHSPALRVAVFKLAWQQFEKISFLENNKGYWRRKFRQRR